MLNWKDNKLQYINLKRMIGKHATSLLWGNGFNISSENEDINKFLVEWVKKIRLQYIMEINEEILSTYPYGRSIITIDKTKGGDIKLTIADPYITNKVGRVFVDEELAVIWKRFNLDDKMYWIKQTYDTEKVVSNVFETSKEQEEVPNVNSEATTQLTTIQIMGVNRQLPQDKQIEPIWYHGLGICPLVEFFNLPNFSFEYQYLGYNNDFVVAGNSMELTLNNLVNEFNKAIIINHPRLFGTLTPELIEDLKSSKDGGFEYALKNIFVNNSVRNSNGDAIFQVLQPDLQFKEYIDGIRSTIELGFNMSGYSFNSSTEKSDLTATGSLMGKELDILTTTRKRNWRITEINRLIEKVLKVKGFEVDDFVFEINTNIVSNTLIESQTQQLLLGEGLTTRSLAISKLHKIGESEAKTLKELIDKEMKEDGRTLADIKADTANVEKKEIVQDGGESTNENGNQSKDEK